MEDCDLTRKSHAFQKSSREQMREMFLVKSHQFYIIVNIFFFQFSMNEVPALPTKRLQQKKMAIINR